MKPELKIVKPEPAERVMPDGKWEDWFDQDALADVKACAELLWWLEDNGHPIHTKNPE